MALSSDKISALLSTAKSTSEVDAIIWQLVKDDQVPSQIAKNFWKWVTIKGGGHVLEVLFAPSYFAVGEDDDFWWVDRTSEFLAQNVADKYNAILPSRKLVKEGQKQSSPIIPYLDVKAAGIPLTQIETHKASVKANDLTNAAFEKRGIELGDGLVLGFKKAMIVHPDLDGTRVCIFGGTWDASGTNYVQDACGPHDSSYSDYSHGIVLVSRKAKLDGEDVDLRDDVFMSKDPSIWSLVNDTSTRFDPVFPNKGSGPGGKMSVASDPSTGKPLGGRDGATGPAGSSFVRLVTGGIIGLAGGLMLSFPPTWIVGTTLVGVGVAKLSEPK